MNLAAWSSSTVKIQDVCTLRRSETAHVREVNVVYGLSHWQLRV